MNWLHYDKFADDGIGFPALQSCGFVFRQIGTCTFLFLLLLIAKGYTITRARLSTRGTIRICIFIVLYIILFFSSIIWQITVFDPARVTYISESLPAYFIIVLRIISWVWFLRGEFFIYRFDLSEIFRCHYNCSFISFKKVFLFQFMFVDEFLVCGGSDCPTLRQFFA